MSCACPRCLKSALKGVCPTGIVRAGRFYRKCDGLWVRRYRCRLCGLGFSESTSQMCYRQRKRSVNPQIFNLLCSGVSQRRLAMLLRLNRKTIVRKMIFLSVFAKILNFQLNSQEALSTRVQFDDMESFEHTKCKPISITLCVDQPSCRVLGFICSSMPAKGPLAHIAKKKYGPRRDDRKAARLKLFSELKPFIAEHSVVNSDENPHYRPDVRAIFPESVHITFKGRRAAVVGQGELKKIGFDPLFSLNHSCAMFRANVNRLFRQTWNTTKKMERLSCHLELWALFHNLMILNKG